MKGFISSYDIKDILYLEPSINSTAEIKHLIKQIDKKKDDMISFDELKAMINEMPREQLHKIENSALITEISKTKINKQEKMQTIENDKENYQLENMIIGNDAYETAK